MYESALDGCVPQPVPGRDLGELALLLDALLVLRALAVAPGLFARRRPRVLPVVAPRALYLRRWGGAGLRARSPAALADLAHDLAVQDHDTKRTVSARRIMARARLGRGISSRCFPRRLERRLTPPAHPRRVDRPAARAGDIGTHGRHRHVARCAPHDDPARHRPLPPRPLPPAPPPPECPI